MIDTVKVTFFKRVLLGLVFVIVFLIGLGFGQIGQKSTSETKKTTETKTVKEGSRLTEDWIEKFLVAYYTKEDLEENRNRYQIYMTDGLYTSIVSEEDKAQNQAYKGYVVNYEFQSAKIYIDTTQKKAICYVNYTNDLRQTKDSDEGAQIGVENNTIIALDYSQVNDIYLVNHMSTLLITDATNPTATQTAYGNVAPDSEEDDTE